MRKGFGKDYWRIVYEVNGQSGQALKEIILQEHTGMGVVAALVATIDVSCLLLTPASYNEVGDYSPAVSQPGVVFVSVICKGDRGHPLSLDRGT